MATNRPTHPWRLKVQPASQLWSLSVGHFISHWYQGGFVLLIVALAEDLGLSLTQVGLLFSVKFWGEAASGLPSGVFIDLVGRRGLFLVVLMLWAAIPYALIGLTSSYGLILVWTVLFSFAGQMWHPAALPVLSDVYPHRRGFALSIHALAANAGDAVAPLLIGGLLLLVSWRQMATLNLLPGALGALMLWRFTAQYDAGQHATSGSGRAPAPVRRVHYGRAIKALARNRGFIALVLLSGVRAMTSTGLWVFLPFYLVRTLGFSTTMAGAYLAVVQTGGLLAAPVSGWLSDRVGRRPVVAGGLLISGILVLVLALLPAQQFFVIVLALLGFFLYSMRPVVQAWTLDQVPPEVGGTAISLLFVSASLFGSLAVLAGGLMADRYGLMPVFYFLAGTIILGNMLVLLVPRGQSAHPAEQNRP